MPQIRALNERARELQAAHDARVRSTMERYSRLRAAVDTYSASIESALAAGPLADQLRGLALSGAQAVGGCSSDLRSQRDQ